MNIGNLTAYLGVDTSDFEKKMGMTEERLIKTGKNMQAFGKKATLMVTLPLLGAGVAAFKASMDFDESMSKIVGLVGVAKEQVESWKADVLALAPEVGRGPKELADALFFITSAGIKGAAALDVLKMSARAAASGLGETETIADLVTSAMNAYGVEVLSAANATDILTATVREGKAEATELAASMGKVLPLASEMGVSFDQVGAAMAGMTRTGTNAAEAATALNAILAALLKPSKDAEKGLKAMGTSAAELRKSIREDGLAKALGDLRDITNEYGEDAMARVIPNIRALKGVLDLMGANAESNIAIFDSLANSTGAADHAFKEASETSRFKFQTALTGLKTVATTLGGELSGVFVPILEKVASTMEGVVEWFTGLNDVGKKTVIVTGVLVTAVGPLLLVLGSTVRALITIRAAILAMNTAWLASPIGWVVAGIGLVAMAFANRWKPEIKQAIDYQQEFNDAMGEEVGQLRALVTAIKQTHPESRTRAELIKQLNEKYGQYLPNLLKETASLGEVEAAYKAVNAQIIRRVALQMQNKHLGGLATDQINRENSALTELARSLGVSVGVVSAAWEDFRSDSVRIGTVTGQSFRGVSDEIEHMSLAMDAGAKSTGAVIGLLEAAGYKVDVTSGVFMGIVNTFNDLRDAGAELEEQSGRIMDMYSRYLTPEIKAPLPENVGGTPPGGGTPTDPDTDQLTAYEKVLQRIQTLQLNIANAEYSNITTGKQSKELESWVEELQQLNRTKIEVEARLNMAEVTTTYEKITQQITNLTEHLNEEISVRVTAGESLEGLEHIREELRALEGMKQQIEIAFSSTNISTTLTQELKDMKEARTTYGLDELQSLQYQQIVKLELLQKEKETRLALYSEESEQYCKLVEEYTKLEQGIRNEYFEWEQLLYQKNVQTRKEAIEASAKSVTESLLTEKEQIQKHYADMQKTIREALDFKVDLTGDGLFNLDDEQEAVRLLDLLVKQLAESLQQLDFNERGVQSWADKWTAAAGQIEGALNSTLESIISGISDSIAAGEGATTIANGVMETLANLAIQVGKIAVGTAIAVDGILKALALNPALALVGGLALIAIGTAAKRALSNAASAAGGGGETPQITGGGWYDYSGGAKGSSQLGSNKPPGMATGGTVLKTGVIKVGEFGEELVVLPAGAEVIPHQEVANYAPGQITTQRDKHSTSKITDRKTDTSKITGIQTPQNNIPPKSPQILVLPGLSPEVGISVTPGGNVSQGAEKGANLSEYTGWSVMEKIIEKNTVPVANMERVFSEVSKQVGVTFRDTEKNVANTIQESLFAALISNTTTGITSPGKPVGKIPGLRTGGTVTKGGSVRVGEAGEEIVNLPSGAEVAPFSKITIPEEQLQILKDIYGTIARIEVLGTMLFEEVLSYIKIDLAFSELIATLLQIMAKNSLGFNYEMKQFNKGNRILVGQPGLRDTYEHQGTFGIGWGGMWAGLQERMNPTPPQNPNKKLASGGIMTRGGMVTVGEAGREDVYLPSGAAVTPNQFSQLPQILQRLFTTIHSGVNSQSMAVEKQTTLMSTMAKEVTQSVYQTREVYTGSEISKMVQNSQVSTTSQSGSPRDIFNGDLELVVGTIRAQEMEIFLRRATGKRERRMGI